MIIPNCDSLLEVMVGNFMRFSAVKRVDIFFRRLDEQVGLAESVLRNRTLS